MNNDHKTVREALCLAEKKCFDATGRIDLELSSSITQALYALDRIEAVETVTVLGAGELSREIQTWRFDDSSEELFEDYIMRKFPNGLRIVQAARQPEQPAAPINQAYDG